MAMAAAITIPVSVFEVSIAYERPAIKLLGLDRAGVAEALFNALSGWHPNIDDIEVMTAGKLSEQGVKLRLPTYNVSFFVGPAGCKFTMERVSWTDVDEILRILDTALKALAEAGSITFGKKTAVLSLHLQLKTVSFKEILRRFIVPEILKLDPSPTEVMAIVVRWPQRRITLDGSASIANAIYVQSEREFDAQASYADVKQSIFNDEVELLSLLGVEEVDA
jgi:hypothetical protein